MATRTPLIIDGSNIREMSSAEITAVVNRTAWEYKNSPSVTLSVITSGGSLGTINDTRRTAGAAITGRASTPASEAETAEPGTTTIGYSRVDQSIASTTAPADTSSLAFPAYYDGSGVRAMSLQDVYDTFVYPAINALAAANTLYTINTSTTLTGYSAVSTTPIFIDTRADTSLYTAAGIPEALDQPTTITNYYLMKANAGTAPTVTAPLQIVTGGNLQQYTDANFATVLRNGVKHAATSLTGYRLRFNWDGTGTNTGSVTNTVLNGTGDYQTLNGVYVGAGRDDYRAQEFPNGSVISNSYYLKINKA